MHKYLTKQIKKRMNTQMSACITKYIHICFLFQGIA